MAIQLRQNETVVCEAHFHWTTFLLPGVWAGICSISILGQILMKFSEQGSEGSVVFTAIVGFAPLGYVWLKNKNKWAC